MEMSDLVFEIIAGLVIIWAFAEIVCFIVED